MVRETAEFAFDLHAGLSSLRISEFDRLPVVGMAAALAIHIKGLGDIEFEVLRKVSDHHLGIPSFALREVLHLLEEIEFVRIFSTGQTIRTITPNIPAFEDIYAGVGEYADTNYTLNEHENAVLEILSSLYLAPRNRASLEAKSGIDRTLFDRCVTLGNMTGIITEHKARGRDILISPYYFSDNLEQLADIAASGGTPSLEEALKKLKRNQGWPLSLALARGEIGGDKLSPTELQLIQKLASEGIVKPPSIAFGKKSEAFLFTPKPGNTRLNAANREIYERAMAIVSAVRKGQLLPTQYRIRYPVRLLEAFRDNGFLKANSEAKDQYQNLQTRRIGQLREAKPGQWEFHLIRTPENLSALSLAIGLLQTGKMADMEVGQEARIAFSRDETYVQSQIAAAEMRRRDQQIQNEEAAHEWKQMMMKLD